MFACAGRTNLPMMCAYIGAYCGFGLLSALIGDVSLDRERHQPGPGAIDPASRLAASFLFIATVVVASLDAGRFHWTRTIAWRLELSALTVFVIASAVQAWAMAVNPFFSSAIRTQSERAHQVMGGGPYHFIRHPGYLAMMLIMPATALALDSLVALIPAFCYSVLILWRTAREDDFLTGQLVGYADYSARVSRRLIPGLW